MSYCLNQAKKRGGGRYWPWRGHFDRNSRKRKHDESSPWDQSVQDTINNTVLWNSKWTFPNIRENIHNHIHTAPKTAKQIWILKKETDLSHMLDIHSKIKDKEWILKGKP